MKYQFPIVTRVLPNGVHNIPLSTKIAYYHIKTDKILNNRLYHVCLIYDNKSAYLKTNDICSGMSFFIAPDSCAINSVIMSPSEGPCDIKEVEIEKQQYVDDKDTLEKTSVKYFPYDGTIDTECLFVPEIPTIVDYEEGMLEYQKQKADINRYTLCFLVGGFVLFQTTAGAHSACSFVAGCSLGILYQFLLQYEMDSVGKGMMLINSASRLTIIALATGGIIQNNDSMVPADIWIATTGFLMQKIAMLIAFL